MKAPTPKISVIMPVYNGKETISQAIDSILNQTFQDFELIIVDDASTDNTYTILRTYSRSDKRIKVIHNKRNKQIAYSLNLAIKKSRSDYIARMDSDDIAMPTRLEKQYQVLENHPDVAIVGANIKIIDKNEKTIGKRTYPKNDVDLKKLMFRYSPFAHPSVVFRKDVIEKFGGYDLSKVPCEDIDLWFKVGSEHKFHTVQKYLLKYRLLTNSNSHKKLKKLEMLGFRIKLNAIRYRGYVPSFYDVVYNIGEFITLWFMPANLRIKLYNYFRGKNLI